MQPQTTTASPSARVYLHPALIHSPQAVERVQRETGMLVVVTHSARTLRLASLKGGSQGGDAA